MKKRDLLTVLVPQYIMYPDFNKKSWRKNLVIWMSENVSHHEITTPWDDVKDLASSAHNHLLIPTPNPPRAYKLVTAVKSVASRVSWWGWVEIFAGNVRAIHWVARFDVPTSQGSISFIVYRDGDNKGTSNFRLINVTAQILRSCMTVEEIQAHIQMDQDPLVAAPLYIASSNKAILRRVRSILGDSKP